MYLYILQQADASELYACKTLITSAVRKIEQYCPENNLKDNLLEVAKNMNSMYNKISIGKIKDEN